MSRNAVYEWLAGRTAPRPDTAEKLTEISRGKLSMEDVYRHRREVQGR